jgi:hypothetical protein
MLGVSSAISSLSLKQEKDEGLDVGNSKLYEDKDEQISNIKFQGSNALRRCLQQIVEYW